MQFDITITIWYNFFDQKYKLTIKFYFKEKDICLNQKNIKQLKNI